jgi:hypothetical protein
MRQDSGVLVSEFVEFFDVEFISRALAVAAMLTRD